MNEKAGARLRLLRRQLGQNQTEFAQSVGFSQSMIGFFERDEKEPTSRFIRAISERYQVNSDWLLYGRGEMLHDPEPGFLPADENQPRILPPDRSKPLTGDFSSGGEDFSLIRRFDVSVSAGSSLVPETENVVEQMAFARSWLLERGLTANLAGLVKACGISMEPTIPDGSIMLVNFGFSRPPEPGIYIFRHDEELFVKHLTVLETDAFNRPRKILAASQNVGHPPMVLEPIDDETFRVIGLVVTVISDI